MLSFIDYLVIGAITNCPLNDNDKNHASKQNPASNFERNIESIKAELGFNFQDNFLEPMVALVLSGAFANGIDEENACKTKTYIDMLRGDSLKKLMKKLIDKQPMPFDELKPYLNMVNPHYFHVLDYILWNTMISPADLTMAQKQLMKSWSNYQKSRLNFD